MPFQSRIFWQPKDEGFWKEYEDAYALNPQRAVAAIADGVSSAMFSGKWAKLLVEAAISGPPDPAQRDEFVAWLEPLRVEWERQIDRPNLKFFQKMKLQEVGGGYSTVLWLETLPQESDSPASQAWRYRCFALGDCCLFHLRGGQILASFPMQRSADFDLDPVSLGSVRHRQDRSLVFQTYEGEYLPDDVLVLATDALAAWIFTQIEAGNSAPWDAWAAMSDDEFAAWLHDLRKIVPHVIRCDDTTLMLLKAVAAIPDSVEAPHSAADPAVATVAETAREAAIEEPVVEILVLEGSAVLAAPGELATDEALGACGAMEAHCLLAAGAGSEELSAALHLQGNGLTESACPEASSTLSKAAKAGEHAAPPDGTVEVPSSQDS